MCGGSKGRNGTRGARQMVEACDGPPEKREKINYFPHCTGPYCTSLKSPAKELWREGVKLNLDAVELQAIYNGDPSCRGKVALTSLSTQGPCDKRMSL